MNSVVKTAPPARAQNIEDIYPLSPLQEGMLFHSNLHPGTGVYWMQDRYRIRGAVHVQHFLQAWRQVVADNPALRTSFAWKTQARPLQVVHKQVKVPAEFHDLRGLSTAEQEAWIADLLAAEQRENINLAQAPLIRFRLIQLADERYEFIRSFHHILMDAWCISLVTFDFLNIYRSLCQGLPYQAPQRRPFRDYIAWLQQEDPSRAQAFWQQELAGLSAPTPLVLEHSPRPSQYDAAVLVDDCSIALGASTSSRLQEFCQQQQITPNTFFQGLWALLLAAYSGLDEVLFGVTVAGRPPQMPGIETMVGLFINTLPLRVAVQSDRAIIPWLQQLQARNLALREFEHTPLVQIQSWSQFPAGTPLFDSLVVFENAPVDERLYALSDGFEFEAMDHGVHTHYGLTLVVMPGRDYTLRISYDRDRFAGASMQRLLGHLQQLCENLLGRPQARLGELSLLSAAERQQLIRGWSAEAVPGVEQFPLDQTYSQLFAQQVDAHPERVVAVHNGAQLNYQELFQRSQALAQVLVEQGVGADDLVAIYAPRGLAFLTGVIACFHAGGAYLPLATQQPTARLAQLLSLSGARQLLVSAELLEAAQELLAQVEQSPRLIVIEDHWLKPVPAVPLLNRNAPDSLAYVLLTSGSTGTPKGVMVEQRGMLNNIYGKVPSLGLGSHDRIAQTASVAFDISVWQCLAAPLVGAQVHFIDDEIAQDPQALGLVLQTQELSLWETVPGLLRAALNQWPADFELPQLRWVLPTGEALPTALARDWLQRYPQIPLMNAYGPAECSDDVAFYPILIPPALDERLPIGRPTANNQLFILDEQLRPQPIGVPGELCAAGVGVGRGYLQDPERTAAAFIEHPFRPGERFYRTGDLARYREDGQIEFLGRRDDQVKIRGQRMELGEIEAVLNQLPDIDEAAVVVQYAQGEGQLVAFVSPADIALDEIQTELSKRLPAAMVPAQFQALEQLPRNANGKLDRKALQARQLDVVERVHEAPQTDTEQDLAQIWAQVLNRPLAEIGRRDSFFALGGHSLLATQVAALIRRQGTEIALRALFEHPQLIALAAHWDRLKQAPKSEVQTVSALTVQSRPEKPPLSFAQQRLWFLEQLHPTAGLFSIPFALSLNGELDRAALERAFQALIQRHEVLRTGFPSVAGEPWQQVHGSLPFAVEVVQSESTEPREAIVEHELDQLAAQPFDLQQPPLIRARVLVLAPQQQVLLVVVHHLISDAWSAMLALRELASLYRAETQGVAASSVLPELAVQYLDFTLWQRQQDLEPHWQYWREQLGPRDEVAPDYLLEIPGARPRPEQATHSAAALSWQLAELPSRHLRQLAQRLTCSEFALVFAAFALFLNRYCGRSDLFIGTPASQREDESSQQMLGILLNNLVIRSRTEGRTQGCAQGGQNFADYVTQFQQQLFQAQTHQALPFEQLVERLGIPRQLNHAPLYQVMVSQQLDLEAQLDWGGLQARLLPSSLRHSETDLNLQVLSGSTGPLQLELLYASALFSANTAQALMQRFEHFLLQLLAHPEAELSRHSLLSAAEIQQQKDWNETSKHYAGPNNLVDALREQVQRTPNGIALSFESESLTYAELFQRVDNLTQALLAHGVQRGEVIAVHLPRSVELVVSLLAIVQAGAAYLPLEGELPADRLAFMLQDSGSKRVLSNSAWREHLPESATVWCLDQGVKKPDANNPLPIVDAKDLVYVIYTSGSTGQPKGVLIEHGALMNRLHWMQEAYPIDHNDVVLQKTPYGFDVSVWEFFWPLITGARLVLAKPEGHRDPAYLCELIQQQSVTTLHFVPSMLQSFVQEPGLADCKSLRQVFTSGEALPYDLAERFTQKHSARLINLYGPTEAAIDVSHWIFQANDERRVVIGKPIANTELLILDEQLQLLPVGASGELFIGGANLARAYLNRKQLTQERFIPHPFKAGQRLYRTGDRCRFLNDGNIEYLGRNDFQVKLRGLRIELGEIEAALLQQANIAQAVVILREDLATAQLVAYVVLSDGQTLDLEATKAALSQSLPSYMLPTFIVALEQLPTTANGKLDRRALPKPAIATGANLQAVQGTAEHALASSWAELLKLSPAQIGRDSDFFQLGGHSLLATQLVARLRDGEAGTLKLRDVFEAPRLQDMAARLQLGDEAQGINYRITAQPRPQRLPLSAAQQRLWFLQQLEPESRAYWLRTALEYQGELNRKALQQALNQMLQAHEVLRTSFHHDSQGSYCRVHDSLALPLQWQQLEQDANWQVTVEQALEQAPFDLEQAPLIRVQVIQDRAGQRGVLVLCLHHLISDDWSNGLFAQELSARYQALIQGEEITLPAPAIQYLDYSLWQQSDVQQARQEQDLNYWRQQLGTDDYVLELPLSRPRRANQHQRAGTLRHHFNQQQREKLQQFATDQGVSLYMLLLAALKIVLARYSGQQEIRVGTPVAGREALETQQLIGCLINTLVLRSEIHSDLSVAALLQQIKDTVLSAQEHQSLPFERLVDELQPRRDGLHDPLFQVLFVMQQTKLQQGLGLSGWQEWPLSHRDAKFDLNWEIHDAGDGLSLTLEYRSALFDEVVIQQLLGHYLQVLNAMLCDSQQSLQQQPFLSTNEVQQQLEAWNDTTKHYPGPTNLVDALREQAQRTPNAVALSFESESLSYAELFQRVDALTQALLAQGVQRGEIIAVHLPRSVDLVVSLLAIVQAGAAYLPLEGELPVERLAFMVKDSGSKLVLSNSAWRAHLPESATVWCLDQEIEAPEQVQARPSIQADDLVYVIYTSGSTGQPKGVLIEHGALMNRLHWMQDAYPIDHNDVVLQKTPYGFDVSVWEFFWPLITGARLVLAKPEGHRDPSYLCELIQQQNVTTLHFVPSMLQSFVQEPGLADCRSLRQVFTSGEALPYDLAERFTQKHSARLINLYGPTEAAIDVSHWVFAANDERRVVIGKPIANTELLILDEQLQLLPVGASGELFIGGANLARAYLNREQLTQERFIPHPFKAGQRLYRTGDRCRFLNDGNIEYLGRNDFQVKLRGLRIELGEIEAALLQQPAIAQAVVILREDLATAQLVAYVVLDGGQTLDLEATKAALSQGLPSYMVPAFIVALAQLPTTANGKLDRRALPAPQLEAVNEDQAPITEHEQQLAAAWSAVLQIPLTQIGRHSDFFQLGGHSLLAVRLIAWLREHGQGALSLRQCFEHPRLAAMARSWQQDVGTELGSIPVFSPRPQRLPLSYAQKRLWVLQQLDGNSSAYHINTALLIDGPCDENALRRSLAQMQNQHEVLRSRIREDAQGPYVWVTEATDQDESFPLQSVLIPADDEAGWQQQCRDWMAEEYQRPFNLAEDCLLRVSLLRHPCAQRAVLLITMHHLISDDWSNALFAQEMSARYQALIQGEDANIAAAKIQYLDYSLWQHSEVQQVRQAEDLNYWRQQLGTDDYVLELPLSRPRRANQHQRAGTLRHHFNQQQREQLQQFATDQGVSLYMLLLAALKIVLARYSGQQEIRVGTPVAGREALETQQLIGCLINTLVLRSEIRSDLSVATLLHQIKDTVLSAQEHQSLPFERLVDELQPRRDGLHDPLFQVLFVMQQTKLQQSLGLSDWQEWPLSHRDAKFDLNWEIHDAGDELSLTLEYRSALFDEVVIQQLLGHYLQVLEAMLSNSEQSLQQLPFLSTNEVQQLLEAWNDTTKHYPGPTNLVDALHEQAQRTPNGIALSFASEALTYTELFARVDALTQALLAHGVQRGQIIAVHLPRSVELVVSLLAIVQAGAAYLPLEGELPVDRLAFMVKDSGAKLILSNSAWRGHLPESATVRCLDQEIEAPEQVQELPSIQTDDLVYVIYTSGSTGQPKGVLIEHGALMNRLHWMQDAYPIDHNDAVLQKTPYGFDVSVWEFFWPLITGARLVLAKPEGHRDPTYLCELIQQQKVTTLHFVPSMLQSFVQESGLADCRSLRQVFTSGEALPYDLAERFTQKHSARLINLYGPTEAAIDVSHWVFQDNDEGRVVIGKPIANTELLILDEQLQLLPVGASGELFIGGANLARAYLNREQLTEERFIAHPFKAGQRLYRTGDRCRFLNDGNIEYLGRNDFQVKLRGLRIELGEIEAALLQQTTIEQAVVILREDLATPQLVAYVVLNDGQTLDLEATKAALSQGLPSYMVPAFIVALAQLPTTANGKLDRRALPAPEVHVDTTAQSGDAREALVLQLSAELLKLPQVGPGDNFFALGGDSILALQLIGRLREQGLALSPRQVFQQPNLAALARVAEDVGAVQAEQGLVVGEAPLLPSQQWFLAQSFAAAGHWNQSLLVAAQFPIAAEGLRQALLRVQQQHDGLRGTLQPDASSAGASVRYHEDLPLDFHVLPLAAETEATVTAALAAVPQHFDLEHGPLWRCVLLQNSGAGRDYLYFSAHHWVMDAMSWPLLLADLYQAYQQPNGELPAKTSSLRQWAQALEQTAGPNAAEREYWQGVMQQPLARLPVDRPQAPNRVADQVQLTAQLSVAETANLLQEANQAYRTQTEELLLAALARALAAQLSSAASAPQAVLITREQHGREAPQASLDSSRTLGWFTRFYPQLLQSAAGMADSIKQVKEQCRAVPRQGLGYPQLLGSGGAPADPQQLLFNYLGQLESRDQAAPFQLSDWPLPAEQAGENTRSHELEVVCFIRQGQLQLEWRYSAQRYAAQTQQAWLDAWLKELRSLIQHCTRADSGGFTPSDFPAARGLNQAALDQIMNKLKKKASA